MTTTMLQYAKEEDTINNITTIIKNNLEVIQLATHRTKEDIVDPDLVDAMIGNYIAAKKAVDEVDEVDVKEALASTATLLAIIVTLAQEECDG